MKARKLIAHRHGVPGYELTSPPTCPSRRNRRAAHPGGPAGLGQGENRGGVDAAAIVRRRARRHHGDDDLMWRVEQRRLPEP